MPGNGNANSHEDQKHGEDFLQIKYHCYIFGKVGILIDIVRLLNPKKTL